VENLPQVRPTLLLPFSPSHTDISPHSATPVLCDALANPPHPHPHPHAHLASPRLSGSLTRFHCSQGQISGACLDSQGTLYIADFAHASVLKSVGDGEQEVVVGVYEDRPLKGPNHICCAGNSVFFSDSGPMGETGLHNPSGSVFCIKSGILFPVALGTLAYPAGIATHLHFVYVAEQMSNRVLRFYQEPEGVFHSSVFYQSAGGVGPSCIACDEQGTLYVGIFETASSGKTRGRVLVLSADGEHLSTIVAPGPEVTGVAINTATQTLYITERSTGTISTAAL